VGFLGPPGTFGEQALHTQPDLAAGELVPLASMPEVLFAVDSGELDVGLVAVENAIEGTVNVTVDTLAFDVDVLIQREVEIPIQMNALGIAGTDLAEVREVVSIPVATAQCRAWLRANVPGAKARQVDSTAEAARQVAEAKDAGVVAVANVLAAERYGLDVLAAGIEDHPGNATRFVAVARSKVPAPTGHDKTTVVVFQHADRPGSLLAILQEFAARSINLTKLESRPTKRQLGDYCFLIDFEGHVADEVVADCLRSLHAEQNGVKFLGSYPAAGAQGPALRRDVAEAFREADAWLADVRGLVQP
jgi:prephenate dehydratase